MKKLVAVVALLIVLAGCTSLKVSEVNSSTGYLPGQKKAAVVLSKTIDLDTRKSLIVVANSEFLAGQLKNLNYFGEVITVEDLEKRIISAGLTDKIPSLRDRIGLSNAAKYYKPFLWLRFDSRGTAPKYAQFVLTDPATAEDYFITETKLDYFWKGVNDQSNWYPMFNSLIDYIKKNSRTYGQ